MIKVYVTDFADHKIPNSIYEKAIDMSVNGNLNDMRTKAARFLKDWAKEQDKLANH